MGHFCDAGCTVTFTKNYAIVLNKGQVVLQGTRCSDGLWYLNTHTFNAQKQSQQQQSLNAITSVHTTKCLQHAIQFLHATLYSPTKAILLTAIKVGFLSSWPLLTATIYMVHQTMPIPRGGWNNKRGLNPSCLCCNPRYWPQARMRVLWPNKSARGNKYIFVFYSWDTNAILMEPMQSKNHSKMLWVYQHMYEKLKKVGIIPTINIMDDEASTQVCHFITNTLCIVSKSCSTLPSSKCSRKSHINHWTPSYFRPCIHWHAFSQAPMGWSSPTGRIHT